MADLRVFRRDRQGREVEPRGGTVALEAELQRRVEASMEMMLGVRFLASEYRTGWHGGRVDSLGIDENGSPVVVEFKRGVDAGVMSQAVSYIGWLQESRHEFEALTREKLGAEAAASVDWRDPRVICVAARPTDRGFAGWSCDWASQDGRRGFGQLQFTQDNDLSDNGRPAEMDGTTGYVSPKEEGGDSCVVYTPHRTFTDSVGDRTIELFRLTVREQGQNSSKVCADAENVAGAAVRKIATSLPGK